MTDTFNSSTDAQACAANTTEYRVEMPCAGSNVTASLSTQEPTTFNFGVADITGMNIVDGMLVITFVDQQTLTIENFAEAMSSSAYQNITLSDGEVINLEKLAQGVSDSSVQVASLNGDTDMAKLNDVAPAAGDDFEVVITKPTAEMGEITVNLQNGRQYNADFTRDDVKSAETNEQGQMVITFNDGTVMVVENYASFADAANAPQMTLADGTVVNVEELLVDVKIVETPEDVIAVQEEVIDVQPVKVLVSQNDKTAMLTPEELAGIETAAGETGAGPLGNSGAGFGSSIQSIGLANLNDVGPIDPTSLAFGLPELNDARFIQPAAATTPLTPPVVTFGDSI